METELQEIVAHIKKQYTVNTVHAIAAALSKNVHLFHLIKAMPLDFEGALYLERIIKNAAKKDPLCLYAWRRASLYEQKKDFRRVTEWMSVYFSRIHWVGSIVAMRLVSK